MPDSLLTVLKLAFLALLYLFFVRAIRVVWTSMTPAPPPAAPPSPRATQRGAPPRRAGRGAGGKGVANRLKVIEPASRRGETYELGNEVTVGRAPTCQITIDDTFVSQLHARIYKANGETLVEDLGSTNGTYLNRKRLTSATPVRAGDRVQVGKTVLELAP